MDTNAGPAQRHISRKPGPGRRRYLVRWWHEGQTPARERLHHRRGLAIFHGGRPLYRRTTSAWFYCIGGQFNHDSQQLDQPNVDIYDPVSDTWREGTPLPYGHSHSEGATFVHGDTIFMVGGHSTPHGGKNGFSGDVLALPAGGEWQTVCKLPRPTSSPAATIIDDNLYFAGGWNGGMDENKVWLMSSEVWVREGITAAMTG